MDAVSTDSCVFADKLDIKGSGQVDVFKSTLLNVSMCCSDSVTSPKGYAGLLTRAQRMARQKRKQRTDELVK